MDSLDLFESFLYSVKNVMQLLCQHKAQWRHELMLDLRPNHSFSKLRPTENGLGELRG